MGKEQSRRRLHSITSSLSFTPGLKPNYSAPKHAHTGGASTFEYVSTFKYVSSYLIQKRVSLLNKTKTNKHTNTGYFAYPS